MRVPLETLANFRVFNYLLRVPETIPLKEIVKVAQNVISNDYGLHLTLYDTENDHELSETIRNDESNPYSTERFEGIDEAKRKNRETFRETKLTFLRYNYERNVAIGYKSQRRIKKNSINYNERENWKKEGKSLRNIGDKFNKMYSKVCPYIYNFFLKL